MEGAQQPGSIADEESMEGKVRFPLEGGVPIVTTPKAEVGPGVVKQVMRRGRSDKLPTTTSKCFVHYQAWTASSGDEIDNTREGHEAHQILLAQAPADRAGLVLGLLSMAEGERALLNVSSELAYGQEGHFSFPAVAANADIIYDVELIAIESGDDNREVRARGDMLWEERMEAAERYRQEGNALFTAGDARGAAVKYLLAISYIDDGMMAQLMGSYLDESTKLKCAIHVNLAGAYLKTAEHDDALQQCKLALGMDRASAKAWFRRGKAHMALGQDAEARSALEEARKLAPGDAAVRATLTELDREEALKAKARKEVFGGLFGASPPPGGAAAGAEGAGEGRQGGGGGGGARGEQAGGDADAEEKGCGRLQEEEQERQPAAASAVGRLRALANWILGS